MISVGIQSNSWVATDGTVQSTNVRISYNSDDNDYTYYPQIKYSFLVNGRVYTGNHWDPVGTETGSSSRTYAVSKLDKYPIGSTVTVYYDANNPSKNALSKGVPGFAIILLVISIIMMIIGIGILIALGKLFGFLFGGRRRRNRYSPLGFNEQYNQGYNQQYNQGYSQQYNQGYNQSNTQGGYDQSSASMENVEDTRAWFQDSSKGQPQFTNTTQEESKGFTPADPVQNAPAASSSEIFTSRKVCPSCGQSNFPADKFCNECGHRF